MKLVLLTVVVFLLSINCKAQEGGCATPSPLNPPVIQSYSITNKSISFYFHIIRDDLGFGGHTNEQVNQQINFLFSDLSTWSIIGVEVGRDILKSNYFLSYNDGKFNELININPHTNAIDVYFTGSTGSSMANDIPGNACVLTFNGIGNRLISHEVGHCLGLLHTHADRHDGTCFDETGSYPGCLTCGDQVCDTPPDRTLNRTFGINVGTNCNYLYDDGNPDTRNIMSYTPYPCAEWFTEGQAERMHWFLDNEQILINTYYYISAPSNLSWSNQNNKPLLQWGSVPNSDLSGYRVYRNFNGCGIDCGSYALIAMVPSSQTAYLDQTVTIGGKFSTSAVYYYVTAFTNNDHESVNSPKTTVPTNMAQKIVFEGEENQGQLINSINIYPNPFNPSTKITLNLVFDGEIKLGIYDILGTEIVLLHNGFIRKGSHEIIFNSDKLSSGVYILSLLIFDNKKPVLINRMMTILR